MTRKVTYSQGNVVLKLLEVESVTHYAQLVSAYLCLPVHCVIGPFLNLNP